MKKFILNVIIIALVISCGDNTKKKEDTDVNNMKSEQEEVTTSSNDKVLNIQEDLSIDNSEIVKLPSDNLRESVQLKLQSLGKSLNTVNSDGSIYMIGTSSTGVTSNRSGFITSRNIAFSKAELRAKIELLRLSGEVITSERNSSLISKNIQGGDPDAAQKASIIEKAAAVVDKSLDKALQELGVSDGEISQLNQSQKEKRYNETFYNYVSSFVGSMVKGVTVIKVVEGEVGSNDYEVAVCIKYSPDQQSSASNKKGLGASKSTLNSKIVGNLKSLPVDKLISKLGAQLFKDENGNTFVLGFGQSSVQKSDSRQSNFVNIARRKSRLQAVENIKNFLSEDLVGKEISETVEKISEFQDGTSSLYTEDNYSELIKSKRSSIKLNTMNIRDWDGIHPVSNTRVIGSIVILTESNNINFNQNPTSKQSKTKKSEYIESKEIEGEEF